MKTLETSFNLSKNKLLGFKFMKMRKHPQLCVEVIYRIFIQEIEGIVALNAENMIQVGHIIVGWRNKRLPVKKRRVSSLTAGSRKRNAPKLLKNK